MLFLMENIENENLDLNSTSLNVRSLIAYVLFIMKYMYPVIGKI